jgi:hypothetical protein
MLKSYSQGNTSCKNCAEKGFLQVESAFFFEKKRLEITRLSAWADTARLRGLNRRRLVRVSLKHKAGFLQIDRPFGYTFRGQKTDAKSGREDLICTTG